MIYAVCYGKWTQLRRGRVPPKKVETRMALNVETMVWAPNPDYDARLWHSPRYTYVKKMVKKQVPNITFKGGTLLKTIPTNLLVKHKIVLRKGYVKPIKMEVFRHLMEEKNVQR